VHVCRSLDGPPSWREAEGIFLTIFSDFLVFFPVQEASGIVGRSSQGKRLTVIGHGVAEVSRLGVALGVRKRLSEI
jgi:hypothetical protein